MKRTLSYAVYILLQCTWGILQTTAGAVYFLLSMRYEHSFYHGSIRTRRPDIGGVSLGLFIFVSDCEENDFSEKTSVHEFGHTIQSLLLGPLYLPVIGLPSVLWCGLPFFRRIRKEKSISYNALYTESWANTLGESVLKMASTSNMN